MNADTLPISPAVTQIMADFDFSKVAQLMRSLDWRWTIPGSNEQVCPGVDRIREAALGLLQHCAADPRHLYVASGGFVARRAKGEQTEYLTLAFDVEYASADI